MSAAVPSSPPSPRRPWFSVWGALLLGVALGAGGHALWVNRVAAQATLHTALATDVEDWALLARTQAGQGRFAEALPACRKAMRMRPDDPTLMADCAEMMVSANGQKLEGEAAELVAQALQRDPRNIKALVLLASAASARGEHAQAVNLWGRALAAVPPEQPQLRPYVQSRLDDDRRQAGAPVAATSVAAATPPAPSASVASPARERPAVAAPLPASASTVAPPAPAAARLAGGLAGTVTLSSDVLASAKPTDTVLITVAAATQPDKVLYSLRKQVKDLPLALRLGPDAAPGLEAARQLVVLAQVLRSGKATAQPGDWAGQTTPLPVGSTGFRLEVGDAVR